MFALDLPGKSSVFFRLPTPRSRYLSSFISVLCERGCLHGLQILVMSTQRSAKDLVDHVARYVGQTVYIKGTQHLFGWAVAI